MPFQVWIGSKPGQNNEIIPNSTRGLAEAVARARVLGAKALGKSLIASVFDVEIGKVISGFATADLANKLLQFPQIETL